MYRGTEDTSLGNILKQLFLKPYFMLYGEVYAPEIDRMLVSFPDLFLSYFINLAIDFPEEMKKIGMGSSLSNRVVHVGFRDYHIESDHWKHRRHL